MMHYQPPRKVDECSQCGTRPTQLAVSHTATLQTLIRKRLYQGLRDINDGQHGRHFCLYGVDVGTFRAMCMNIPGLRRVKNAKFDINLDTGVYHFRYVLKSLTKYSWADKNH